LTWNVVFIDTSGRVNCKLCLYIYWMYSS
jgi:hypothetical protein